MGEVRFHRAVCLVSSVLVSGCVTQDPSADKAAEVDAFKAHLPPNYRQIVANDIKTEPDYQGISIKNAQISNPEKEFGAILRGGTVVGLCVRYQTRGRFLGQDTGPGGVVESVSFTYGQINHPGRKGRREIAMLQCNNNRTYVPFPEINTE